MSAPELFDTHAHLHFPDFADDLPAVLARARAAGVSRLLTIGADVETSAAAVALAAREANVWAAVGIHPHDAGEADDGALAEIERLATAPRVVAVGEIGLDFFRNLSPREAQERTLRHLLDLARRVGKPALIHCRDAHEETVELLRSVEGVRGVMHCYTMGPEEVPPYLELGFFISFSGVVTYPKNEKNREAARAVPSDRILFETDCPFLAPQGQRGTRNEPALVRNVLETVSAVRGVDLESLARASSANAARLFRLSPP